MLWIKVMHQVVYWSVPLINSGRRSLVGWQKGTCCDISSSTLIVQYNNHTLFVLNAIYYVERQLLFWTSAIMLNVSSYVERQILCWTSDTALKAICYVARQILCWTSYTMLNVIHYDERHIYLMNVRYPVERHILCWTSDTMLNVRYYVERQILCLMLLFICSFYKKKHLNVQHCIANLWILC